MHSSWTTGDHGSSAHDLCSHQPRSRTAASAATGPGQHQSSSSSGPTTEAQRSPHQPCGTPPSSLPRPPWATAPVRAPVPALGWDALPRARLGFSAKQGIGGAAPSPCELSRRSSLTSTAPSWSRHCPRAFALGSLGHIFLEVALAAEAPLLTPEHHQNPQSGRSGETAGHRHLSCARGSQIRAPHAVGSPSPRPRF